MDFDRAGGGLPPYAALSSNSMNGTDILGLMGRFGADCTSGAEVMVLDCSAIAVCAYGRTYLWTGLTAGVGDADRLALQGLGNASEPSE